MERLENPTPDMQERLLALLEEDLASRQQDSAFKPVRAGLQESLSRVLTREDWELVASAAGNSVREQVMERFQGAKTA